jgi:hypothetical protein
LVGKSEGRKLLLRPGCGSEDAVNKDLKETRWGGMDCIYLCQGWVEAQIINDGMGCCEHSYETLGSIKCREFLA